MPKRKKHRIKLNSVENLENIMQEVYNDANSQINDANSAINVLVNSSTPEDVQDITSIAREKANLLKIKDSATKIKLDIAKLEADIIKSDGNSEDVVKELTGGAMPSKADLNSVRELIRKNNNPEPDEFDLK